MVNKQSEILNQIILSWILNIYPKLIVFFIISSMKDIFVKKASKNIVKELNSIGFDSSYTVEASSKYEGQLYKIFNLKPYEANILKQLCLSLGFDCAVNRNTIMCKCETTDAIIFATNTQLKKLIQKLYAQPFRLNKLAQELNSQSNRRLEIIEIRNKIFDWSRPYIMGILNVTPDSFSDGGKYNSVESALIHCEKLIKDGADIIDIGGESTRPDALPINADEEKNRVIPIIKAIRNNFADIPISIDTRNYETAKSAIEIGADIINDVSGLDFDKKLFNFVCEKNIPVIIMHSNKVPAVSSDFVSGDIVEEIYISLKNKIDLLVNSELDRKNIIIDVGIGFGKSIESNFELLKRLDEFQTLNCPMILGISRKSFIRKTFDVTSDDADLHTALYSAMLSTVNIHRVHNVKLTKKYIDIAQKLY